MQVFLYKTLNFYINATNFYNRRAYREKSGNLLLLKDKGERRHTNERKKSCRKNYI